MIQTIAQFYAQKIAGMLISDAMAKKFGKKQTADSVARAAADFVGLPLYQYIGGIRARELPVPMMNQ